MKGFLAAFKQRYATIPVPPEKLPDVALLAQLWADQDDATQGNPPGRQTRPMRGLAMMAFGAAAMAAIDVLT